MRLNINPFNRGNPMTLKDATVVASAGATVVMILDVMANASLGQVRADPLEFLFNLGKSWLTAWAGNFITLAGLEQLVKRTQEEK